MASHTHLKGSRRRWSVLLGVFVLFALGATASALGMNNESGSSTPWIASDQADYTPGARVTLNGGNWAAGESVHINVNDDHGQSWSRDVDVIADADGKITDSFNLPDWFIATYFVRATGASGTATSTFTDGNVKVSVSPATVTASITATLYSADNCTGTTTAKIAPGTVGVGSSESLRLDAAATGTPSAVFDNWTVESGVSFTVITGTSGRSICISGDFNGSKDAIANYTVSAANSAPAIAATNATVSVDEGQTANNSGTWSDANAGDTVTLSASVGAVTKSGTNASGMWSWSYATTDGPAQSQTVTITANDGNGGSTSTSFALTVNNVAPSATFNAPSEVNEGSSISLSLTDVVDPGTADTHTYRFSCDGGTTWTAYSATSTHSCPTTDDGTKSVKGQVRDDDGGESPEYSASVTVKNVAPTATFNAPSEVNEGSSISLSLTDVVDPGTADTHTYRFSCDGGTTWTAYSATSTHSCPTTDDGTKSVKGQVRDDDGGESPEYSASVTVKNVAPTVVAGFASTSTNCQTTATLSIDPSDPGVNDSPWKVIINWGDGNTEPEISRTNLDQFDVTHVYTLPGSYNATVTVTDKDGGIGSDLTNPTTINQTYTIDFRPPFDDSTPSSLIVNKMKNGRVVPVKVTLYDDCRKAAVTDPDANVTIKVSKTSGTGTGDPIEEYADAGQSSAGTNAFRWADGFWIYNLDSTYLGLVVNNLYRVDVYVGAVKATVANWAVLQPVK